MQKLNKKFYVGCYLLSNLGQFVFISLAMFLFPVPDPATSVIDFVLTMVGSLLAVLAFVVTLILAYKMWAAIQGLGARTSPGLALGLMFIPLFQLFWQFVVYWGWTKDYNKLRQQAERPLPGMPEGLALAACILPIIGTLSTAVSFIAYGLPRLGQSSTANPGLMASAAFQLLAAILTAALYSKVCDGVNALVDAGIEPQLPQAQYPPQDAKTSRMAIASLVLGICGYCTAGVTSLIGIILGIGSLTSINKSRGSLKGKGLAIAGIAVSGVSLFTMVIMLAVLIPTLGKVRTLAKTSNNARNVALFISLYARDHDDHFPPVDTWPQALEPYMAGHPDTLTSPAHPADGRAYAMNAKLDGLKTTDVSTDTVMLFECQFGSPPAGGPELLPQMPRGPKGYIIAFADGKAQSITPDAVEDLHWNP